VQFATAEGKPVGDTKVQVFAPDGVERPDLAGATDSKGKFEFPADEDGFWIAQAQTGQEVIRVMVRVGGPQQHQEPLSPYWIVGALVLLLVLAFTFRILRARMLRRRR
jgi:hypothetical protein